MNVWLWLVNGKMDVNKGFLSVETENFKNPQKLSKSKV